MKLIQTAKDAVNADKGIFMPASEDYVYRKLAKMG
ncbi:MAG: hypothetical protein ACI38A_06360 [Candidatus Ornithomonoglobus sp.]